MNRLAKNNESTSVIIATAPKKGLLKGFIEASVKMQPREFIYLSFNPDTLVCDLKLFKQNGYETKAILDWCCTSNTRYDVHLQTR